MHQKRNLILAKKKEHFKKLSLHVHPEQSPIELNDHTENPFQYTSYDSNLISQDFLLANEGKYSEMLD